METRSMARAVTAIVASEPGREDCQADQVVGTATTLV